MLYSLQSETRTYHLSVLAFPKIARHGSGFFVANGGLLLVLKGGCCKQWEHFPAKVFAQQRKIRTQARTIS